MGINGYSEATLRDYLFSLLGSIDAPDEVLREIPFIAKEVNDIKLKMRRASDGKPTHELLLAYIMLAFFVKGKTEGIRIIIEALKKSMEKLNV